MWELGMEGGSEIPPQPSLTFSPLLLCPLISGPFRTPRRHRPEGNGPGFGEADAREACGSYRDEEGGVQSQPRGWCLSTELAVPSKPPRHPTMSKFPSYLEGSATDPRVSGLAGLGVLPIVYPPGVTEDI